MSITVQLQKYAHGIIKLDDLNTEAFNTLNEIFDELYEEEFVFDSRDFKQWLSDAFDNGIYNEDNLE